MGNSSTKVEENATNENDNRSIVGVIELLIVGFIRNNTKNHLISINKIPKTVMDLFIQYYKVKNLIIGKGKIKELYCTKDVAPYIFDSILIKERGKLTVNEWNTKTESGGTLHIICNGDITISSNAHIDLNGKGYLGGHGSNMSGESYKRKSKQGMSANLGGGGGGNGYCAGGGGYGTSGIEGKMVPNSKIGGNNPVVTTPSSFVTNTSFGKAGKVYGNKKLSILHLGSGGGSIFNNNGGAGGGALKIICLGSIILNKRGKITANGINGIGNKSGCGSGGSIHIIVNHEKYLKMNVLCEIKAIGERNWTPGCAGDGGHGRIRIQCKSTSNSKQIMTYFSSFDSCFEPKPYLG